MDFYLPVLTCTTAPLMASKGVNPVPESKVVTTETNSLTSSYKENSSFLNSGCGATAGDVEVVDIGVGVVETEGITAGVELLETVVSAIVEGVLLWVLLFVPIREGNRVEAGVVSVVAVVLGVVVGVGVAVGVVVVGII